MAYFSQQLINAITLGAIYGLIAIGYTMVYGIIGMINFAHGDVFMVGGFIALIAFLALVAIGVTAIPIALFLVLIVAMAITALYGWTVERFAYRPLRDASAERLIVAAREHTHFLETLRAITPLKLFGREQERRAQWQNLIVEVQNRDVRTARIGLAMSTFYYPFFLLPLWLSFYWQRGVMRFLGGLLVAGLDQ